MQISISNKAPQKISSCPITERVKTFEDACEVLGIKGDILVGVLNEGLSAEGEKIVAHTKLLIIVKALNQGWTPDWDNSNQYKYYVWWDMRGGFSLGNVYGNYRFTDVPSCLYFQNEDLATYAAKQFLYLYKSYMV